MNEQNQQHKVVIKNVRAELSQTERYKRARELADVMGEIESVQEQAKSDAQRHKSKVEELNSRARKLRGAIQSGEEWSDVQCREEPEERLGRVKIVRLDTDEVVDYRPMSLEERQVSLPLGNGKRKKKGGGEQWAAEAQAAADGAADGEQADPSVVIDPAPEPEPDPF